MENFVERLSKYTPEQRRLLEERLRQKGIRNVSLDAFDAQTPTVQASSSALSTTGSAQKKRLLKPIEFSLFYFSSNGYTAEAEKYRFLLETASFGDEHGFAAVWLPERHLQEFGGLYPNPSLLASALAVTTKQIRLRAGSVVAPLHHPVRIAEEWSIVDNLSQGRVGISFATGWHPGDFVLCPENYVRRRELMLEDLRLVRQLWRGETVVMPGGDHKPVEVMLAPKPVQAELPCWITTSGNSETWQRAGEHGTNVLAALAGQSVAALEEGIALYRAARARHNLDPQAGKVTVMLHAFIDEDPDFVRATVKEPLYHYLGSFLGQFEKLAAKGKSEVTQDVAMALEEVSREDLLSFSFERYFHSASLLGNLEKCAAMVEKLRGIGVDEIACLIDFGPDLKATLHNLEQLAKLKSLSQPALSAEEDHER